MDSLKNLKASVSERAEIERLLQLESGNIELALSLSRVCLFFFYPIPPPFSVCTLINKKYHLELDVDGSGGSEQSRNCTPLFLEYFFVKLIFCFFFF